MAPLKALLCQHIPYRHMPFSSITDLPRVFSPYLLLFFPLHPQSSKRHEHNIPFPNTLPRKSPLPSGMDREGQQTFSPAPRSVPAPILLLHTNVLTRPFSLPFFLPPLHAVATTSPSQQPWGGAGGVRMEKTRSGPITSTDSN